MSELPMVDLTPFLLDNLTGCFTLAQMKSRLRSHRRRQRNKEITLYEPTDPHDAAGRHLLYKYFFRRDPSCYSSMKMLKVRNRFMKKLKQSGHNFTCWLCGKENLDPDLPCNHSNLATLDHIIPLSKGGRWNDERNFQIACCRCNNRREKLYPHTLQPDFLENVQPVIIQLMLVHSL